MEFRLMEKQKLTAAGLSDRARKELSGKGMRYWYAFVYGYMTSRMDDRALKAFEDDLELVKKKYPKSK